MISLLVGVLASLLALALIAAYLPLARYSGWFDEPNARSAHREATPNSGGIAVVSSILLVALVAVPFFPATAGIGEMPHAHRLGVVLAVICVIGAWDDRRHLSAEFRLGCFFVAAGLLVAAWWNVDSVASAATALVLVVAYVWLINLYNFMDGLDGLAALQAVAVTLGLICQAWLLSGSASYLACAATVGGAYLGFLAFNWPPARLFMGDAGSLPAGVLLGWLGLWGCREGYIAPLAWMLLMSPFVIDATTTLLERIWRRERLTEAHKDHLYQRLAVHWGSHRRVVLALMLLHLVWLQPLAIACAAFPESGQTFFAIGIFPQLFLLVVKSRLK